ncbi:unnamed protein product [Scytosiphon promiscuus]
MGRRGRSSALRGVQRTACALALAVIAAVCSKGASFVIPHHAARPAFVGSSSSSGRPSSTRSSSSSTTRWATRYYSGVESEGAPEPARRQGLSCLSATGARDGGGEASTRKIGGAKGAAPTLGLDAVETGTTPEAAAAEAEAAAAARGGGGGGAGGAGGGVPLLSSQSTAPARTEIPTDVAVVGAPQQLVEKEYSIEAILKELAEIQNQGPKNVCVLGTRHCSFLHQQIIELLAYALVLSGNHVFTSGAMGTNAATIRGALRAERKELLTVVLPQSLEKQSEASRELIQKVTNVVTNPINDHLPLDAASRLCNSDLLSRTEQLICFAFHDSKTIIETTKEARSLNMIVTELYLD